MKVKRLNLYHFKVILVSQINTILKKYKFFYLKV